MPKKLFIVLIISLFLLCGCTILSGGGNSSILPETRQSETGENKEGASPENRDSNRVTESPARATRYVEVKYRDDPVDIAAPHFEYFDTSGSSFIRGAWYDQGNQYLVINLDGVYYHYCGLPPSVWSNFKEADSFGRFYNQNIKVKYDCRQGHVPGY